MLSGDVTIGCYLAEASIRCVLSSHQRHSQAVPSSQVFLEISQNSQENTCVRVPFLIKLQALYKNVIRKGLKLD